MMKRCDAVKQSNVKKYFKPKLLDEAVSILNSYEGVIKIIAGGTDIFTEDHKEIEALLDIEGLGLNYIKKAEKIIKIGSATTFNQILKSDEIYKNFRALWDSASVIADKSIRNIATIGGNIGTAVPSGDVIPPLYVLGAAFIIRTANGEKEIKPENFFIGPRKTILKKDDILKEIQIPYNHDYFGSSFEKVARNSVDLATSSVAVLVKIDDEEKISEAKIAFGAVAPTVVRAKKLEEAIIDTRAEENKLQEVVKAVKDDILPISDVRSTADYRYKISQLIAKRAIIKAYDRASKVKKKF
jgi:CO/xanthine dehydrogenase FAD-binding subunit